MTNKRPALVYCDLCDNIHQRRASHIRFRYCPNVGWKTGLHPEPPRCYAYKDTPEMIRRLLVHMRYIPSVAHHLEFLDE